MDASRLLALGVLLCAAPPSWAERPARAAPALIELDGLRSDLAHPLPQRLEVRLPEAAAPTEVHLCEAWECDLYRTHLFDPAAGALLLDVNPPSGPAWLGEHYVPRTATSPTRTYASHQTHAIALYGTFPGGALLSSTLQRGARDSGLQGGVAPIEATALLFEQPEQALSFAGVVIAPDAVVGDALLASLRRLLGMGGVVAAPRALAARLADLGTTPERELLVDDSTRLVQLGSNRVLAEGARSLDATAVKSQGGVIVLYEPRALSETFLADALLAAVPRFSAAPRLSYSDARETPASRAAGIAASRPAHALLLTLPLLVASGLLLIALRSRRRGAGLLTRSFVVVALGSAVALVVVPRALDDDGARVEVRSYVSFGDALMALEEGALAERPASSGGEVTFSAPLGALPIADLRGIEVSRPVPVSVSDEGRTLRFPVHGDGIGVASWLRPVPLEGLRVEPVDGAWPRGASAVGVENRLPFPLDVVLRVGPDGAAFAAPPLAPGARTSTWSTAEPWTDVEDAGSDPLLLARTHLLEALRQRCRTWGGTGTATSCVLGIGTAPDGALIGVQVLSP